MIAGVFLLKTLTFRDIIDCFVKAAVSSSIILLIIAMAGLFSQVMALEHLPRTVANFILGITDNKYTYLLLVNILLLFMGMIMETSGQRYSPGADSASDRNPAGYQSTSLRVGHAGQSEHWP